MEIQTGIFDTALPPIADDAFLLSLVQAGDEQAVATLFDRYSRIVYSVALRVLSDPASAEDVLHEVFLQLWRAPASFTAVEGSLGGRLAVLARNLSIAALRRRRPLDLIDAIALAAPSRSFRRGRAQPPRRARRAPCCKSSPPRSARPWRWPSSTASPTARSPR